MTSSVALNRALDSAADEIYYDLDKLVKTIDEMALKNSQLNSLVAVANASTSVTQVAQFVEYQASRDSRTFDGWRSPAGEKSVADTIAEFSKKAATQRAEAILKSPDLDKITIDKRSVAVELVRRYVLTFSILYRYRLKQEGRFR